jgi:putative sporulation protein YyaC
MVAHEDKFKGIRLATCTSAEELSKALNKFVKVNLDDLIFFCVGTDRCTGDALAPFVGTFLKEIGYENVMGTIDEPIHAMNLDEYIDKIPHGKTVIAIDASMGRFKNVGNIYLNSGALYPGRGTGKNLTPVGDFHIEAVVNVSMDDNHSLNYQVLSSTRLSLVMKLAKIISESIQMAFSLYETNGIRMIQ